MSTWPILANACLVRLGMGDLSAEDETLAMAHEVSDEKIGPYRLTRVIGEGGYGTVFAAEQQEPVRRRVALKVVKLGMDTRQVVARFQAEKQTLASLAHPNIAQVFDAGITASGRQLSSGLPAASKMA